MENKRLLSLDFYRGLTMFLLIAEFSHLFTVLISADLEGSLVHTIATQFHHVDWAGLHFWDLIQPFFTLIVGVSMPLSFANRVQKGTSYKELRNHAFKRAFILLLLGWWLYCIDAGEIVFRLQNVLAQLSLAYLIAFFIIKKPISFQIGISFLLLTLSESLYRFFPLEGFNNAFVAGENFGAWINILISGEKGGGNWAIFNAIPTAAHTIWGVIAGQILISKRTDKQKLLTLFIAGGIGLLLGYGLNSFTPIIKRIATSSFVLVSGSWALIALTICYWLIDIKQYNKGVSAFALVGMNPLFIYIFAHIGGADLLRTIFLPFTSIAFGWMGELGANIALSCMVLFALWFLCYWLYKKKIFIRI